MAIQMISMQCPNCNANLEADSSREFVFCQYCGTKVKLHDTNTYTVNINETCRVIDEAELVRAQTEHAKVMQSIDREKYAREALRKKLKIYLMIGLPLLLFPFIVLFIDNTPPEPLNSICGFCLVIGGAWSLYMILSSRSMRRRRQEK